MMMVCGRREVRTTYRIAMTWPTPVPLSERGMARSARWSAGSVPHRRICADEFDIGGIVIKVISGKISRMACMYS